MKIFLTLPPETRRNLLTLFVAGLLFWASIAALLPVLPLYVQSIGGGGQTIGIVMGAFAIGLLGTRSSLAQLADVRGRKLVLLIGIVVVAIAPLGYIATESFSLLIGVRAFHGISIAAFALAYSALVVDLAPSHSRGEVIGYMSLVNPIGMGLGPALGGFLESQYGFTPAFLMAVVLGTIGLLFTLKLKEPYRVASQTPQPSFLKFWQMLGHPSIRTPALVLLLIGISFGALTTFVPLLVNEAQVSLNVGLFYSMAAIAGFIIRLLVGRASDYYGRGPFISISLVFYAISMATLWLADSAPMFLLAGFLEGMAAGTLIPMMAALMADRAQTDQRGLMFSLCMVGFDLGIAMAGPLLGAIAAQSSYRYIFGLSALLSCLGLVVFLTLSSKDLRHSLRFALGRGRDVYALDTLPVDLVSK